MREAELIHIFLHAGLLAAAVPSSSTRRMPMCDGLQGLSSRSLVSHFPLFFLYNFFFYWSLVALQHGFVSAVQPSKPAIHIHIYIYPLLVTAEH